jgi:hypothetical protein
MFGIGTTRHVFTDHLPTADPTLLTLPKTKPANLKFIVLTIT